MRNRKEQDMSKMIVNNELMEQFKSTIERFRSNLMEKYDDDIFTKYFEEYKFEHKSSRVDFSLLRDFG